MDNVIEANVRAATSNCTAEALNIGVGDNVTVNALVEHLNEILGTNIEPIHNDPRPGDVRHSHADISKAREEIGYDPSVDFREGLERTVETAGE